MADRDTLEEQQLLIDQLKDLIRQQELQLEEKTMKLQESEGKVSRLRLQSRAKKTKMVKADLVETCMEGEAEANMEEQSTEDTSAMKSARAKMTYLRKKLDSKDHVIREKEETINTLQQHIEAKERVLAERDNFTNYNSELVEENSMGIETFHADSLSDSEQAMYTQIVYKDRKLLEMNSKLLEMDRRLIDVQELVGEKQEVIHGRDRVVKILQDTIKEKDQINQDQEILISSLTTKTKYNEERLDFTSTSLSRSENQLKSEAESFHIKLAEIQHHFEVMITELERDGQNLSCLIHMKDKEILCHEQDTRDILLRHEREIQQLTSKGNMVVQDDILALYEHKLNDLNGLLDKKNMLIENLQAEAAEMEKKITFCKSSMKTLKEKLWMTSEQLMLVEARLVDQETVWNKERENMDRKMVEITEKHEHEISEKELHLQSLQRSVNEMESAYQAAISQYSVLQERYERATKSRAIGEWENESCATQGSDTSSSLEMVDLPTPVSPLKHHDEEAVVLQQDIVSPDEEGFEGHHECDTSTTGVISRIAFLEHVPKQLHQEDNMTDELLSLKSRLVELEDEKGNLLLKLVDFDDLETSVGGLKSLIEELTDNLKQSEIERGELMELISASNSRGYNSNGDVTDLQTVHGKLLEEYNVVKKEFQTVRLSLDQLTGEKISLEITLTELEEEKEAMEKEKADLISRSKSLAEGGDGRMQADLAEDDGECKRNTAKDVSICSLNDKHIQTGLPAKEDRLVDKSFHNFIGRSRDQQNIVTEFYDENESLKRDVGELTRQLCEITNRQTRNMSEFPESEAHVGRVNTELAELSEIQLQMSEDVESSLHFLLSKCLRLESENMSLRMQQDEGETAKSADNRAVSLTNSGQMCQQMMLSVDELRSKLCSVDTELLYEREKSEGLQKDLEETLHVKEKSDSCNATTVPELEQKSIAEALSTEKERCSEDLQGELHDLKMCLEGKNCQICELLQKLKELQSDFEEKSSSLVSLTTDCQQLRIDRLDLSHQVDGMESQLSEWRVSDEELQHKLRLKDVELNEKTTSLITLFHDLEERVHCLQQRISYLESTVSTHDQLVPERDTQLAILTEELDARSAETQHLMTSVRKSHEKTEAPEQVLCEFGACPGETDPDGVIFGEGARMSVGAVECDDEGRHQQSVLMTPELTSLYQDNLLASTATSLQRQQLESAQREISSMKAAVRKKDKIIKGLYLKQRKATPAAKVSEGVCKNVPDTLQQHMSVAMEERRGPQLQIEFSTREHCGYDDARELSEEECVIIERNMLKKICAEKDIQLIQFQADLIKVEYQCREDISGKDEEIEGLQRKCKMFESEISILMKDRLVLEHKVKVQTTDLANALKRLDQVNHNLSAEHDVVFQMKKNLQQLQAEKTSLKAQFMDKSIVSSSPPVGHLFYAQTQSSCPISHFTTQRIAPMDENYCGKKTIEDDEELHHKQYMVSYVGSKSTTVDEEDQLAERSDQNLAVKCEEFARMLNATTEEVSNVRQQLAGKESQVTVMEDIVKGMMQEKERDQKLAADSASTLEVLSKENVMLMSKVSDLERSMKMKEARLTAVKKQLHEKKKTDNLSSGTNSPRFRSQCEIKPITDAIYEESWNINLESCNQIGSTSTSMYGSQHLAMEISCPTDELSKETMDVQTVCLQNEVKDLSKKLIKKDARLLSLTLELQRKEKGGLLSQDIPESSATANKDNGLALISNSTDLNMHEVILERDRMAFYLHGLQDSLQRAEERNDILEQDMDECESRLLSVEENNRQLESYLLDIQAIIHHCPREDLTYLLGIQESTDRLHQLYAEYNSLNNYVVDIHRHMRENVLEKDNLIGYLAKSDVLIKHLQIEKHSLENKLLEKSENLLENEDISTRNVLNIGLQCNLSIEDFDFQNVLCSPKTYDVLYGSPHVSWCMAEECDTSLREKSTQSHLQPVDKVSDADYYEEVDNTIEQQLEDESLVSAERPVNVTSRSSLLADEEREVESSLSMVDQEFVDTEAPHCHSCNELRSHCNQLESRVEELHHDNNVSIEESSYLREELMKMRKHICDLEVDVEKCVHERQLSQQQTRNVEADVDYQRSRAEKLLKHLREKDDSEVTARQECLRLREKLSLLQLEMKRQEDDNSLFQRNMKLLGQQEQALSEPSSLLHSQLVQCSDDCADRAEKIFALEKQLDTLEHKAADKNQAYLQLELHLARVKENLQYKCDCHEKSLFSFTTVDPENAYMKWTRQSCFGTGAQEVSNFHEDTARLSVCHEKFQNTVNMLRLFIDGGNEYFSRFLKINVDKTPQVLEATQEQSTVEAMRCNIHELSNEVVEVSGQYGHLVTQFLSELFSMKQQVNRCAEQFYLWQEIEQYVGSRIYSLKQYFVEPVDQIERFINAKFELDKQIMSLQEHVSCIVQCVKFSIISELEENVVCTNQASLFTNSCGQFLAIQPQNQQNQPLYMVDNAQYCTSGTKAVDCPENRNINTTGLHQHLHVKDTAQSINVSRHLDYTSLSSAGADALCSISTDNLISVQRDNAISDFSQHCLPLEGYIGQQDFHIGHDALSSRIVTEDVSPERLLSQPNDLQMDAVGHSTGGPVFNTMDMFIQVPDHQSTVDPYGEQLNFLQDTVNSLNAELADLKEQKDKKIAELDVMLTASLSDKASVEGLYGARCSDLELLLEQSNESEMLSEQKLEELDQQFLNLGSKYSHILVEKEALETEMHQAISRCEELNAQLSDIHARKEDVDSQLLMNTQHLEMMESRLSDLSSAKFVVDCEVERLVQQCQLAGEQVSQAEAMTDQYNGVWLQLDTVAGEYSDLKEQLYNNQQELQCTQAKLQNALSEISVLQDHASESLIESDAKERQALSLQDQVSALLSEMLRAVSEAEALQEHVSLMVRRKEIDIAGICLSQDDVASVSQQQEAWMHTSRSERTALSESPSAHDEKHSLASQAELVNADVESVESQYGACFTTVVNDLKDKIVRYQFLEGEYMRLQSRQHSEQFESEKVECLGDGNVKSEPVDNHPQPGAMDIVSYTEVLNVSQSSVQRADIELLNVVNTVNMASVQQNQSQQQLSINESPHSEGSQESVQLLEMEAEMAELKKEFTKSKDMELVMETLNAQLQQKADQMVILQDQLQVAISKVPDHQSTVDPYGEQLHFLQDTVSSLNAELTDLKEQKDKKIAELDVMLTASLSDKASVEGLYGARCSDLELLQEQSNESEMLSEQKLEELDQQFLNLGSKYSLLLVEKEALETERHQAISRCEQLNAQLSDIHARKEDVDSQLLMNTQHLEMMESRLSDLSSAKFVVDCEVERLVQQCQLAGEQVSQAEAMTDQYNGVRLQLNTMTVEYSALKEQLFHNQQELQCTMANFQNALSEISVLQDHASESMIERDAKERQALSLQDQISALLSEMLRAVSEAEALQEHVSLMVRRKEIDIAGICLSQDDDASVSQQPTAWMHTSRSERTALSESPSAHDEKHSLASQAELVNADVESVESQYGACFTTVVNDLKDKIVHYQFLEGEYMRLQSRQHSEQFESEKVKCLGDGNAKSEPVDNHPQPGAMDIVPYTEVLNVSQSSVQQADIELLNVVNTVNMASVQQNQSHQQLSINESPHSEGSQESVQLLEMEAEMAELKKELTKSKDMELVMETLNAQLQQKADQMVILQDQLQVAISKSATDRLAPTRAQIAEREEGLQARELEEGLQAREWEEGLQAREREEGLQAREREEGLQAREREEGLQARERVVAGKELLQKKALATVKKLSSQLKDANKELEQVKADRVILEQRLSGVDITTQHDISQSETVSAICEDIRLAVACQTDVCDSLSVPFSEISYSHQLQSYTYSEYCQALQDRVDMLTCESYKADEFSVERVNFEEKLKIAHKCLEETKALHTHIEEYQAAVDSADCFRNRLAEANQSQETLNNEIAFLQNDMALIVEQHRQLEEERDLAQHKLQLQINMSDELLRTISDIRDEFGLVLSEKQLVLEQDAIEMEALRRELENRTQKAEELATMVEDLQTLQFEQFDAKENIEAQLTSLLRMVDSLQDTLANRDIQMEDLIGQVNGLRSILLERDQEVESLQASLAALLNVIEVTKCDLDAATEDFVKQGVDFEKQVVDFEKQVVDFEKQGADYEKQGADYEKQVYILREKNQQLGDQLFHEQEEKDEILSKLKEEEIHTECLENELHSMKRKSEEQIMVLTSELSTLQLQVQQLGEEKDSLETELLTYKSYLIQSNEKMHSLKNQIAEMVEKVAATEKSLLDMDAIIAVKNELEGKYMSVESQVCSYRQEIDSLNRSIVNQKQDSDRKCKEIFQLQSNYLDQDSHISQLHHDLMQIKVEREQLDAANHFLRGQIEELEKVVPDAHAFEHKSKGEGQRLPTELNNSLRDLSVLKDELESSHEDINAIRSVSSEAQLTGSSAAVASDKQVLVHECLQQTGDFPTPEQVAVATDGQPLSVKEHSDSLLEDHKKTLSSLQSTELKCVKMLTKLKAFKGKNEKLQLELNEAYLLADERVHEAQRLAENEMRDLIGRLNDVEAQNGQLIDENSIMRESAMFTAQQENRCLVESNSQLVTDVQTASQRAEDSHTLSSKLQSQVDHLMEEVSLAVNLRNQLSDLKGQYGMLQQDNVQYQHLLDTLTAKNKHLKLQLTQQLQPDRSKSLIDLPDALTSVGGSCLGSRMAGSKGPPCLVNSRRTEAAETAFGPEDDTSVHSGDVTVCSQFQASMHSSPCEDNRSCCHYQELKKVVEILEGDVDFDECAKEDDEGMDGVVMSVLHLKLANFDLARKMDCLLQQINDMISEHRNEVTDLHEELARMRSMIGESAERQMVQHNDVYPSDFVSVCSLEEICGSLNKDENDEFSVTDMEEEVREQVKSTRVEHPPPPHVDGEGSDQHLWDLECYAENLSEHNTSPSPQSTCVRRDVEQVTLGNGALLAKAGLASSGDGHVSRIHEDHAKLHAKFTEMVGQRTEMQAEINRTRQSQEKMQLRCQQMAAQVSQLVKDRTYLNAQLNTLSHSLREKEAECQTLQQQSLSFHQEILKAKEGVSERHVAVDISGQKDGGIVSLVSTGSYIPKYRFDSIVGERDQLTGRVKSLESCLAEESAACQQAQRTLDGAQELVDLQSAKSLNEKWRLNLDGSRHCLIQGLHKLMSNVPPALPSHLILGSERLPLPTLFFSMS